MYTHCRSKEPDSPRDIVKDSDTSPCSAGGPRLRLT
eukprot:gene1091-7166_t